MNINRHSKGFTLVELLVVIAIIGILAVVTFIAVNPARAKARDARRLSDIHALMTAIELYKDDNGGNAPANVAALTGATPPYMATAPTDPSAGSSNCGASNNAACAYTYTHTGTTPKYYIQFLTEGKTALGNQGTYCATSLGIGASPCTEQ